MGLAVCVICARSGSKGVPDKNVRELLGKPLLAHSVEVAVQYGQFDSIIVTSDSEKYLDIARHFGATDLVKRPAALAADKVTKLGAIEHAVTSVEKLKYVEYETIVDLDVTSPLRLVKDITASLELFYSNKVSSVITACRSHRSPYTNLVELNEGGNVVLSKSLGRDIQRRQESPECFDMNASVYIWDRAVFKKEPKVFYQDTLLYEMPFERSWDIDNEIDFELVEFFMRRREVQSKRVAENE